MYSARAQDGPQDMERNEAAARHSWDRQHAWLLLRFFPFPVGHSEHEHCRPISSHKTYKRAESGRKLSCDTT